METKSNQQHLPNWVIYSILASASIVLAYTYYYITAKPNLEMRLDLHQQIILGQAPSPYQYRLLIPFLGEALFWLFKLVLAQRYAFALAYVLLDLFGIFLLLASIFTLLSQWFRSEFALLGSLFCAAVLPLTFFEHYFQPWSFWEAALYTLGLFLIFKGKRLLILLTVLLVSLNRETGIFLVLAFFIINFDFNNLFNKRKIDWATIKWSGLYAAIWLAAYLALRLLRPATSHVETLAQIFQHNINLIFIFKAFLNWLLFMGIFWLLAARGWKQAPIFLRRAALVMPFHIILILIFAYWSEVRVFMPHYAVLIGLGLSSIGKFALHSNE